MNDKDVIKEYIEDLLANNQNPETRYEVIKKALDCSLDIRKFEIDLYWKRATYFWAFIAVIFAAYFGMLGLHKYSDQFYFIIITIVGYIFAFAWYLVNRGSKFWQKNWEMHVDYLEEEVMGSLHRMVKTPNKYNALNLLHGYPSSVSKINQLLSFIIMIVWASLIGKTFYCIFKKDILLTIGLSLAIVIIISLMIFKVTKNSLSREDNGKPYIIQPLSVHKPNRKGK